MGCKNCKENILSETKSLIGSTKCTGDCPENVVCQDLIPSSCIYYSGESLPCADIQYTDRLTDVIKSINSKLFTLTSDSIVITESIVDNCKVINLEAPSGEPNTDEYVSATIGGATDVPGFLVDKLSSSDGSVAINTVDPEVSSVNLTIPCINKTKVSDVDTEEECGFLIDKFTDSALLPVADYSVSGDPRIKFIKQVRTYTCTPEVAATNLSCSPAIADGVTVNPSFPAYAWSVSADTMKNPGDITFDSSSGIFKVVAGGIYDIYISFGMQLDGGANASSFVRLLLNYHSSQSGICLTYGNIYCDEQSGVYGTSIAKAISIVSNSDFVIKLYNFSGASTRQQFASINLSFEKVG